MKDITGKEYIYGITQDKNGAPYLFNVGELVRCKDCIHYDGWCGVHLQPRLETDFCNYGDDTIPLNYVELTEEARAKMKGGAN